MIPYYNPDRPKWSWRVMARVAWFAWHRKHDPYWTIEVKQLHLV